MMMVMTEGRKRPDTWKIKAAIGGGIEKKGSCKIR